VESLRDLRAEKDSEIAALEQRIGPLERQNTELRTRLARIEAQLSGAERRP
jgi:predicted  nucleic acid-binding Zn-ribbon protein